MYTKKFREDLITVINGHSKENDSNTPDWILADFIIGCLKAFNAASNSRECWYGLPSSPAGVDDTTLDEDD